MIPAIPAYNGFNITFQVTEECNLRCLYCYEHNKRKEDMPLAYARRFIELLIDDPDPVGLRGTPKEWIYQGGAILDFIGGDALMKPELCDHIIRYFMYYATTKKHRWARRWRASISTNGTLFGNPQVRKFMNTYKENISVGVSIDGCPEIHDRNRRYTDGHGSMETIMKWWPWYREWSGGHISTKATLNKSSIPFIKESVTHLHEHMGITYIHMNFIFEDMGLSQEDIEAIDRQLEATARYVLFHRHDLYFSMLCKHFGTSGKNERSDWDNTWCGAGAMPCLVPDGKIYPCFRFTPITISSTDIKDLNCGDIWNGIHMKQVLELVRSQTRRTISPSQCFDCDYEKACSWCIGGAYAENGTFYRGTNLCSVRPIIAKWADWYWEQYAILENTSKEAPDEVCKTICDCSGC